MEGTLRVLRGVGSTLALVAVAAACGWLGISVLRSLTAQPALQAGDYSAIVREAGRPVVLFATTTCPYCRQARELLDAMKVEHVVYDIDVSQPARALYDRLHANSVPVLVTTSVRITGFDEAAYRAALGERVATGRSGGSFERASEADATLVPLADPAGRVATRPRIAAPARLR